MCTVVPKTREETLMLGVAACVLECQSLHVDVRVIQQMNVNVNVNE